MSKCPFLLSLIVHLGGLPDGNEDECKGDECAWWAPLSSCCAVRDLPGILIAAGNVLGRIHVELSLSRYTYTCHECGVRIEKTASGEFKTPTDWILEEQTDGKLAWFCDNYRGG